MLSVLGAGEASALFMLASSLCIAQASAEGLPAGPTEHKDTNHKGETKVQLCYSIQKPCDTSAAYYSFSGKSQHSFLETSRKTLSSKATQLSLGAGGSEMS